jgi:transcriptional activator of cad operon
MPRGIAEGGQRRQDQAMNEPAGNPFEIGAWRVEPALDQLVGNGKVVKLEPRTMRLLLYLAVRAGQVVSVEQLLTEVWGDVVVTPDSVYQCIAGLRRALGDDKKSSSYIVNVPRRGYRLVADVTSLPGEDVAAAPPGPAAKDTEPHYLPRSVRVPNAVLEELLN